MEFPHHEAVSVSNLMTMIAVGMLEQGMSLRGLTVIDDNIESAEVPLTIQQMSSPCKTYLNEPAVHYQKSANGLDKYKTRGVAPKTAPAVRPSGCGGRQKRTHRSSDNYGNTPLPATGPSSGQAGSMEVFGRIHVGRASFGPENAAEVRKFPELESFTFCGTFKEKVAEAEHVRVRI